jgi:hypothetical protein
MAEAAVVASFLALADQLLAVYTAAADHHVSKSRLYLEIDNWKAVMSYAEELITAGVGRRETRGQTQHVVDLNYNLALYLAKTGFVFENYSVGSNGKPGRVLGRPWIRLGKRADIIKAQVDLIREQLKILKEVIEGVEVSFPTVPK